MRKAALLVAASALIGLISYVFGYTSAEEKMMRLHHVLREQDDTVQGHSLLRLAESVEDMSDEEARVVLVLMARSRVESNRLPRTDPSLQVRIWSALSHAQNSNRLDQLESESDERHKNLVARLSTLCKVAPRTEQWNLACAR